MKFESEFRRNCPKIWFYTLVSKERFRRSWIIMAPIEHDYMLIFPVGGFSSSLRCGISRFKSRVPRRRASSLSRGFRFNRRNERQSGKEEGDHSVSWPSIRRCCPREIFSFQHRLSRMRNACGLEPSQRRTPSRARRQSRFQRTRFQYAHFNAFAKAEAWGYCEAKLRNWEYVERFSILFPPPSEKVYPPPSHFNRKDHSRIALQGEVSDAISHFEQEVVCSDVKFLRQV